MMSIPHVRMRDTVRIYNALDIGLLLVDGSGTVIWANKYYGKIARFEVSKYIGRDVREISRSGDVNLPTSSTMIDVVIATKKRHSEIVRFNTAGEHDDYIVTNAYPVLSETDPEQVDYVVYSVLNYNELMRLREAMSKSAMRTLALESHLHNLQINDELGKDVVMADKKMYDLYGKALRLSTVDVSVMITGESGVGKDVLAKFIHVSSLRKSENFIHVNVAAIPGTLFESELFGYTPGAFTGASKAGKDGLIHLANNGTLFLDEIGDLPLDIQAKLLQVLQEHEVRAIGATKASPVNFRVICATNRDLEQMVARHEFRLDLYYRLNTVKLEIPPLRERRDDIPLLTNLFMRKYNKQNKTKKYLSSEALQLLTHYSWPGNVRELQHVVESLVALCPLDTIMPDQLPQEIRIPSHLPRSVETAGGLPDAMDLRQAVAHLEKQMIQQALYKNPTALQAAAELGIDASTLSKKRKRYGI